MTKMFDPLKDAIEGIIDDILENKKNKVKSTHIPSTYIPSTHIPISKEHLLALLNQYTPLFTQPKKHISHLYKYLKK